MRTLPQRPSAPSLVTFDRRGVDVGDGDRNDAGTVTTLVPSAALVELIGSETLQGIQDAFAIAFDIPTVILDHEGHNVNEITHRVAFCEDFTRPSRAGSKCLDCDRSGMRISSRTHRPTIFKCWNELHDCTVPIVSSRGELFGYFLSGQVLTEEDVDLRPYRGVASEHGIDEDAYVDAAANLRVVPMRTYARSIECIGVLARMIADQASAGLRHRELLDSLLAAQGQTQHLAVELDEIAAISSQIAGSEDQTAAMHRLADAIERVIPNDSMVIFELEPGGRLHPVMVRDPFASAIAQWEPGSDSGLVGKVVRTGTILHLDDVTADPGFEPIPGVPVEPEALLAVPLQLSGDIIGAVQLSRFHRQTFTKHEGDLLKIIASYTAVALGTASLRARTVRYTDVVRSQRTLREWLATGMSVAALLENLPRQVERLFECEASALRFHHRPDATATARLHMSQREHKRFEREHAQAIARACSSTEPVTVADGAGNALIVPFEADGQSVGYLMLVRHRQFPLVEQHLALSFAQQSGMVIESAVTQHRLRNVGARIRRLAEVGGAVVKARQRHELAEAVTRAHELVDGRLTILALSDEAVGGFRVRTTDEAEGEREIRTAGRPELRLPEVRGDSPEFEDLFDAWGGAFAYAIGCAATTSGATAVPLWQRQDLAGAIIVIDPAVADRDGRSLLHSVARLVEAGLRATASAHMPRTSGLEHALILMHESAQRLLAIDDPAQLSQAVVDEFVSLAGTECVLLVRDTPGRGPQILAANGLSRSAQKRLLGRTTAEPDAGVHGRGADELHDSFELRSGGQLLLIGPRGEGSDPRVRSGFLGYAGLALERAWEFAAERERAHDVDRERRGLADKASRLEAVVDTNSLLTEAALSRAGFAPMTGLLARLFGADVAIYGTDGGRIASSNNENELLTSERPDLADLTPASQRVGATAADTLVATPILADGEHLGWIAHADSSAPAIDPAVSSAAAVTSAFTLLRVRAAAEAEARMRGDFVDSLLQVSVPGDELIRHGAALGYDLTQPCRVAVAELQNVPRIDVYRSAVRWAAHRPQQLLIAEHGSDLVVVGPRDGSWPEDLHEELARTTTTRLGVGPSTTSDGFAASHLAALRAAQAMGRLGRTGVLRIDDDHLEQLLLRSVDPERLAGFRRTVLDPLDEYDRGHDSSLRQTVELACETGWNILATARAAHVHHSTLRYRLARISQLTGLDLAEQDGRLSVQLALLLDRLAPG
jgi:ligand-binding sensor protein/putative methionine-R-sulfoxide reductase with GAF domain